MSHSISRWLSYVALTGRAYTWRSDHGIKHLLIRHSCLGSWKSPKTWRRICIGEKKAGRILYQKMKKKNRWEFGFALYEGRNQGCHSVFPLNFFLCGSSWHQTACTGAAAARPGGAAEEQRPCRRSWYPGQAGGGDDLENYIPPTWWRWTLTKWDNCQHTHFALKSLGKKKHIVMLPNLPTDRNPCEKTGSFFTFFYVRFGRRIC